MATLASTQVRTHQVDWLHWLYVRGDRTMSCGVESRGDQTYVLTLLPLWSPDDQVIETFRRPADVMRRHAQVSQQLQEAGWLLVEGGPVKTAA
jgi:hypothetical protein